MRWCPLIIWLALCRPACAQLFVTPWLCDWGICPAPACAPACPLPMVTTHYAPVCSPTCGPACNSSCGASCGGSCGSDCGVPRSSAQFVPSGDSRLRSDCPTCTAGTSGSSLHSHKNSHTHGVSRKSRRPPSGTSTPVEADYASVRQAIVRYMTDNDVDSICEFKYLFPAYQKVIDGLKPSEKATDVYGGRICFPSESVWTSRADIRQAILRALNKKGVLDEPQLQLPHRRQVPWAAAKLRRTL